MTHQAQNIARRALELRELGQKRDARALIIDNKLDGLDLLQTLRIKQGTSHFDPDELVGIITMMDSVIDEMRDQMREDKRNLEALKASWRRS